MGDVRFAAVYDTIRAADNPLQRIRSLNDEEVIAALAATPRRQDPYLANVLATEAMNRTRRANTINMALGEGVCALDDTGRVTFVNPAAERMLQLTQAELRGVDFHDVVHVQDENGNEYPRDRCPIWSVLKNPRIVHWDDQVFTRGDGTRFPVEGTVSPAVREEEVQGVIVVFRDATARKRAERQMRRQKLAMDAAMDGIAVLNPHEEYVYVNRAHARIYGYDRPDEVVGRTWRLLYADEEAERFERTIMPTVRREGWWRGKGVGLRRDGSTFPQELTVSCLDDGGLVCVVRDITDRERAEAELRDRLALERTLVAVSTRLVGSGSDMDAAIEASLQDLGRARGASRAYVFLVMDDGRHFSSTHEWCDEGVTPHKAHLQNLPVDAFPWMMEQFRRGAPVYVPDVGALPPEADGERAQLSRDGVRAALGIPIFIQHGFAGFVGFDHADRTDPWGEEDILLLSVVSDVLANAIARTRAEDELRRQSVALDHAGESILFVNPDARIAYANRAACRAYGYDRDTFRGLRMQDIEPGLTTETWARRWDAAAAEGPLAFETDHRARDGRTFPVEVHTTHVHHEGREHLASFIRDVTERKRAERGLAESEQRYRSLFDRHPDAVYEFDVAGTFTTVNPACQAVSGYTPDDLVGSPFMDLVVPEDRERAWRHFERALGGEPQEVELAITHKDGHRVDLNVMKLPIMVGGMTVGVYGIARDVTRFRREGRARADQQRRLEAVFAALGEEIEEGFAILDTQGRLVSANRAAERILALSREHLSPEHPAEYDWETRRIDGTLMPDDENPLLRARRTREPVRGAELAIRTPDGRCVPIRLNMVPVTSAEDELTSFIVTFTDLTHRKATEAEVARLNRDLERRVEELQTAYGELDAFSYTASHDLRAPIRAIGYLGDALVEDHGDALPEGAREYVERIRREVGRVSDLVNDLLRLSRVSRAEVEREDVDVSEMAQEIAGRLRDRAPGRRVEMDVQPGVTANADPQLLRIVLENLLENAWKYTAREPVARIAFSLEHRDGEPVYVVRDNGVGFAPDQADKLFAPFERLHAATEYPGTGIGLATVKRIVERHGGQAWAEGQPGRGATFRFTL